MANQSTLRPTLDGYIRRLRNAPKSWRWIAVSAILALIGALGLKRRGKNSKSDGGKEDQKRKEKEREKKSSDGSRTIWVPYKNRLTSVSISATKSTTFDAHRRLFLEPRSFRNDDSDSAGGGGGGGPPIDTKPGLNLAFLHQFLALLSIMVPRATSKEAFLLLLHTGFLIARTYLSLLVARLDGSIVRDLVAGNGKSFLLGILQWLALGVPSVYCNAMIKYLQSKLSIAFRTRLTRYIHDLYLNDKHAYYNLQNLDGSLPSSADQFIAADLPLFCDAAAGLYSNVGKPAMDLVVFNWQLAKSLGPLAFVGIMVNYVGSAWMLKRFSPPFGRLAAAQGKREGELRAMHARLIGNAEEVAFYNGAEMELEFLNKGFRDLKTLMEGIYSLKIRYNILEDLVLKYGWSALGYIFTSLPIFLPLPTSTPLPSSSSHLVEQDRTKNFITSKRLMLSLADAGGRLMYSLKDLSLLAGYTSRVYSLISTLHRIHAHAYPPELSSEEFSLADVTGGIYTNHDHLRLENVPVIAPRLWPAGGTEIVKPITVAVRKKDDTLVLAGNGTGKSCLVRVLAGLWPTWRGLISMPSRGNGGVVVMPQRGYFTLGGLGEQITYPTPFSTSPLEAEIKHLEDILAKVGLSHIPPREGGFTTAKDWASILSGGEKQRLLIARLFFHNPSFAILDEPTAAVARDGESMLFSEIRKAGITTLTFSSRAQLKREHVWEVSFVREGEDDEDVGETALSWVYDRIGAERERVGVRREIEEIKERLEGVGRLRGRLGEILAELGEVGKADELEVEVEMEGKGKGREVEVVA